MRRSASWANPVRASGSGSRQPEPTLPMPDRLASLFPPPPEAAGHKGGNRRRSASVAVPCDASSTANPLVICPLPALRWADGTSASRCGACSWLRGSCQPRVPSTTRRASIPCFSPPPPAWIACGSAIEGTWLPCKQGRDRPANSHFRRGRRECSPARLSHSVPAHRRGHRES